jgi:hypothetical protein
MEWLNTGIGPLKDLISFLNTQSRTNNVHKKQLIRELTNNLNVFKNGFLNNAPYDPLIDLMSNQAVQEATRAHFSFRKLHPGAVEARHVYNERNRKYIGWTAERLLDKIDEKIVELQNIKKLNGGTVVSVKNNIPLMMSNLYYRMKLLADFIRSA